MKLNILLPLGLCFVKPGGTCKGLGPSLASGYMNARGLDHQLLQVVHGIRRYGNHGIHGFHGLRGVHGSHVMEPMVACSPLKCMDSLASMDSWIDSARIRYEFCMVLNIFCRDYRGIPYGTGMAAVQTLAGFCMESAWVLYRFCLEFCMESVAYRMDSARILFGLCMDPVCILSGL